MILCHSLLPFISTAISFDNSGHVQSLSVSLSLINSQVILAYLSMKLSAIIVISPQAVLKKEMGIFQRAFENLLRSNFLSLTCLIYSCSKSIFFSQQLSSSTYDILSSPILCYNYDNKILVLK